MLVMPAIPIVNKIELTDNDDEKAVVKRGLKEIWTDEDQQYLDLFNRKWKEASEGKRPEIEVID